MYQKDIGYTSANEAMIYNYWSTVLFFLEQGLPWDYIDQMTPPEVTLVLAIMITKKEREAEEHAKTAGMGMR